MDQFSSDAARVIGPPMLCATRVIKPGPVRIGRLAADITLPRTVPLVNLILGGAGFLVGLVIGGSFFGTRGALYFGVLFAAGLLAAASYSPLKGESMLVWAGLRFARLQSNQIFHEGVKVRVSVGICPVPGLNAGRFSAHFGAANVAAGAYDERGAPIPAPTLRSDA